MAVKKLSNEIDKIISNQPEKNMEKKMSEDKLIKSINDFKKNIKQYQQSGEKELLRDTIQIYKNIIIPIQLKIRELKYQVVYIDKISQSNNGKINKKEMPIFHFMPTKIDIKNETFIDNDFEIQENKK